MPRLALTPRLLSSFAYGGIVGPAGFIAAWVSGAVVTSRDYSSVDDAISQLAAVGADTQPLMTMGFVVFGVALPVYALALRTAIGGWAWITAASTGLATLGVALLPLAYSESIDRWHEVAAGVGYVTLAVTPWLAFGRLRSLGHTRLAHAGLIAGAVSAVSLVLSVTVDANGFFQRLGLSATDLWLVASVSSVRSLLSAR